MISARKYAEVRIEITLQVLVGELSHLERDLTKIPLSRVVEIWEPETISKELYWRVKMLEERRAEKLTSTGKKRAKRKGKGVASEIEGADREENQGPEPEADGRSGSVQGG